MECICRFGGRKCNSGQWWSIMINVYVRVKTVTYVKKIMFRILLYVIVKMETI